MTIDTPLPGPGRKLDAQVHLKLDHDEWRYTWI